MTMPILDTSIKRLSLTTILLAVSSPAFAHHPMGGVTPGTFAQGLLSGLGHPVIGLDHLAIVIAVGCLAALHRAGIALVAGFVLAMILGAAAHVGGMNIVASEVLLAGAVVALGVAIQVRAATSMTTMVTLFALGGLLSGYALGESIIGAERAPLFAYLVGLAVVQFALALAVMWLTQRYAMRPYAGVAMNVRLIGAAIIGIGFAGFVTQVISNG
jgi:urease accessory protein